MASRINRKNQCSPFKTVLIGLVAPGASFSFALGGLNVQSRPKFHSEPEASSRRHPFSTM